jgi:hypothetical protein
MLKCRFGASIYVGDGLIALAECPSGRIFELKEYEADCGGYMYKAVHLL